MRLLIVEDNAHLAELLAERLTSHGFSPDQAASLAAADEHLRLSTYDLIILDLGLPDGDGLQWLRSRRERALLPPTLILTARSGLEDRVAGLDAGADDYMVKPFEMDEMLARLRALMRRPVQDDQPPLDVGLLHFDTGGRTGRYGRTPLELTRREADLLEFMMRRVGALVPRQALEEALYARDDATGPNALEAVVSRVRRKLEAAGAKGMLQTMRGLGYLLRDPPGR